MSHFFKNLNFSKILLGQYLWCRFQQDRTIFGGVRAQNLPKMAHFMDAASPRKHWKIYNLTTTNAIKIKLTTISYLHIVSHFHLAKDLGVTHRAWEGVVEKPLKKSHKIGFLA